MIRLVLADSTAQGRDMPALRKAASMEPKEIIELVRSSGLVGKGGGCFPAAEKWALCSAQGGEHICVANFSNCDDDNKIVDSIIQSRLFPGVEGLAIACLAVGAEEAYIFLRLRQKDFRPAVEAAALAATEICPQLKIHVYLGEKESDKGQAQLVMKAIERGVPITEQNYTHAAVSGLFGKPTLYHSVETLTHVPAIVLGKYKDNKLVQVIDSASGINCVLEMDEGTTVAEVLKAAGVQFDGIKAVSIGGYMGALFTPAQLDTRLERDELMNLGGDFGDLVLRVLRQDDCIVNYVMECYARSSVECCGRCVYGRLGSAQIHMILQNICSRKGKPDDLALLCEVAEGMKQGCSCNQGKCAANMILTAVERFRSEFEAHIVRKLCPSRTCRSFLEYYIDPVSCTGCGDCLSSCHENAIEGEDDYIHVIDGSACTSCGKCVSACKAGAVKLVGSVKPKLPDEPIPVGSWKGAAGARRRRR